MMPKKDLVAMQVKIPKAQHIRLGLLLKTLEDAGKKMTMNELLEKIITDFLE